MSQKEEVLNGQDLVRNSEIYRLRQAEVAKINEHKWYESEKAGHDIGFIQAEFDWTIKGHRKRWLKYYLQNRPRNSIHVNGFSARDYKSNSNNHYNSCEDLRIQNPQ